MARKGNFRSLTTFLTGVFIPELKYGYKNHIFDHKLRYILKKILDNLRIVKFSQDQKRADYLGMCDYFGTF